MSLNFVFMAVSLILPFFNEESNLSPLVIRCIAVFRGNRIKGEIVLVNDGSSDNSLSVAKKLCNKYSIVKLISYPVNKGKSFALSEGFKVAKGDIIMFMDADLEHDPSDIPLFLKKINEGFDAVNGWRFKRKHNFMRRYSSKVYNWLASVLFGLRLHDFNCGLKAFKKEVIKDLRLRPDFHRYILPMIKQKGYTITEVKVKHMNRPSGKSKYGFKRLFIGLFDLFTLKLLFSFSEKPMFLFGLLGLICLIPSLLFGSYLFYIWLFKFASIERPLLTLTTLLFIVSIQFFSMGFLAELIKEKRG